MRQRPAGRRPVRADSGETLIELMVTIVIMSTAVLAIVGATATSIHLSDIHRKQAEAGSYLRAYAEALEAAVAKPTTGYKSCATTDDYSGDSIGYTITEAGWAEPTATTVRFWNGSRFTRFGCTGVDVQQVTLRVRSASGDVTETLDVVIRRPCPPRNTDPACA